MARSGEEAGFFERALPDLRGRVVATSLGFRGPGFIHASTAGGGAEQ
jgi:hypothetical protein